MSFNGLEINKWVADSNELLERVQKCFINAPNEKVQKLSQELPDQILIDSNKISIMFCGQYSAGKSTIIKALTNQKGIAIGRGITTEDTTSYQWGGCEIIDTPGIHTEVRPDHDEITYKAISNSDLLVFVITNELFDSHLAEHFRELAIDRGKANEMILVVNKMGRCAKGNSIESQNIIKGDIEKIIEPYKTEDLKTTFIDAQLVIDSKNEESIAIADIYRKKSGFNVFIDALNIFIRDKGLTSRYTTSLYSLEHILQEAITCEMVGDTDISAMRELLLQNRRALMDTKQQISTSIQNEIQKTSSQVRSKGIVIADKVNASTDSNLIEQDIKQAQREVDVLSNKLEDSIQDVISKCLESLNERSNGIRDGELAKKLASSLEKRFVNLKMTGDFNNAKQASDIGAKFGTFLVKNSFTSTTAGVGAIFKLKNYSGTATHNAVKAVGKHFGKSFKPWEAVKWTKNIAHVGRALVVVGTVATFALQYKEDIDAKNMEANIKNGRIEIKKYFNEAAQIVEMHFDEATQTYVENELESKIISINKEVKELDNLLEAKSKLHNDLRDLVEETRCLIEMIQSQSLKIS